MRRRVQRWSAILVGAMVVAGCGDDPDGEGAAPDSTTTTVGPGVEASPGGTVDEWIAFESPEGRFRMELPSEPVREQQPVPSDLGPLEATVFTVRVNADLGYLVAYTDYPEQVLEIEPGAVLDGAVQGAATNVSGTVESSTKLTVDSFPAVDYVIAVDEGRIESRAILAGQRVYLLQRVATQPDPDDFRRLVDSFELLPS